MNKKIMAAAFISAMLLMTSCSANKDNTPELVSGGQTTVANLFYNMASKTIGLVGA